MGLFANTKSYLMRKFVVLQEMKDTKKEIKDIKHVLSLLMDHYWDIDASKALPAKGILREQQLEGFDLLVKVTSVLEEVNINYWLDYGTLLGSVRHQGYIPWDDDLDIGALAKDKDKILEALKKHYPDYKYSSHGEIDPFLKVADVNAEGNESVVDIFLYNKEAEKMYTRVFVLAKTYNRPFPEEIIFPLQKAYFEGKEFYVPNNSHLYLKKNYGEYMSVPKKAHVYEHQTWDAKEVFYDESGNRIKK